MAAIFLAETNASGRPTKYSCEQLMEYNEAYSLSVDYYYDIMHDAGLDTTETVADGKAALLDSVAKNFGVFDGSRCSIPPVTALWLIEVSSGPADSHESEFSKLELLVEAFFWLVEGSDICLQLTLSSRSIHTTF